MVFLYPHDGQRFGVGIALQDQKTHESKVLVDLLYAKDNKEFGCYKRRSGNQQMEVPHDAIMAVCDLLGTGGTLPHETELQVLDHLVRIDLSSTASNCAGATK